MTFEQITKDNVFHNLKLMNIAYEKLTGKEFTIALFLGHPDNVIYMAPRGGHNDHIFQFLNIGGATYEIKIDAAYSFEFIGFEQEEQKFISDWLSKLYHA